MAEPALVEASTPDIPVWHSGMRLHSWRPTSTAIVVHVAGELDASNAGRLHELLAPRLASTAEVIVLDLSEVEFFGVVGLELLAHARRRTAHREMTMRVVDGPVCVERALWAAGWAEAVETYSSLQDALTELTGRDRGRACYAAENTKVELGRTPREARVQQQCLDHARAVSFRECGAH